MKWLDRWRRGNTSGQRAPRTDLDAQEGQGASVSSDNPIRRIEDDSLGRADHSRHFVRQVLALDPSQGLVVGVLGPWGTGKTSFVNLSRGEFEAAGLTILDFNPWMFSGAQQLVESFFNELAAQLKVRPDLADVGEALDEYGESFSGLGWIPFLGPWIERGRGATKVVAAILQRRKEGVGGRRTKLEKALAGIRRPVLVVLDDIDRLSTAEIRDIFKLVRLTASFPNVIYLVAFDRQRVETALQEQGVPGRDYLEKILQVAVDLPAIPAQDLSRLALGAVDAALAGIERRGPFIDEAWPDLFMEVVRPLIRTMRDVRRYAAAIHGTVAALDGQIALTDVLALEAVRVFLPDVYVRLDGASEGLTTTSGSGFGRNEPPRLKEQVQGLLDAAASQQAVVRAMINRLFPAAQRHVGGSHFGGDWTPRWLRDRRVAHEDILRLYLERTAGEGLRAFTDAERAWAVMEDRAALEKLLRGIDPPRLQDVIAALENFEEKFTPEHAVPGVIVLLNLLPDLPERQRGMFEMHSRFAITRVVYRLMKAVGDPVAVEAAVRQILPEVESLSARMELIRSVGHREHVGHQLVSEPAAAAFEREWRSQVRAASGGDLVREYDLARVLMVARSEAEESEEALDVPDDPRLTFEILKSSVSEVRSQAADSRAVRRSARLPWAVLAALFGCEAVLSARLVALREVMPASTDEVLLLAEKYGSGWRPDD